MLRQDLIGTAKQLLTYSQWDEEVLRAHWEKYESTEQAVKLDVNSLKTKMARLAVDYIDLALKTAEEEEILNKRLEHYRILFGTPIRHLLSTPSERTNLI